MGCLKGNEAPKSSPRPSSPSTQACPMNTFGWNMRGSAWRGWQCWGNPSLLGVPRFIRMIVKSLKPTRHKVVSKYQEALGENVRAVKISQGHPLASSSIWTQNSLEKFVAFISILDPFSSERKCILLLVTLDLGQKRETKKKEITIKLWNYLISHDSWGELPWRHDLGPRWWLIGAS